MEELKNQEIERLDLISQVNEKLSLIQDLKQKKLIASKNYQQDNDSVDKDYFIRLSDKLRWIRKELTILNNKLIYLNKQIKTSNIIEYKISYKYKVKIVLIEQIGLEKANEILQLINNK